MRRGYLMHIDSTGASGEGLGSQARGSLYPLLHVALESGLVPVYSNENLRANVGRDYTRLDLASFLNFDTSVSVADLQQRCAVLTVNTWSDAQHGSALGDVAEITRIAKEIAQSHTERSEARSLLLVMDGPFRYMLPSAPVRAWLSWHGSQWRSCLPKGRRVRVAVHVRRGDTVLLEGVPKNRIGPFLDTIDEVIALNCCDAALLEFVLFTELEGFSKSDEDEVLARYPRMRIEKGTSDTILCDLRGLAEADVLIPSASHFSALASYLASDNAVVVLPEASEYFAHHLEHRPHVVLQRGDPSLRAKLAAIVRDVSMQ